MLFKNRIQAGKQLAKKLSAYRNKKDVIVLGIPRGGVEVAFSIAKALKSLKCSSKTDTLLASYWQKSFPAAKIKKM